MTQRLIKCMVVMALAVALSGCSQSDRAPVKEVQVPDGGAPVLTTEERTGKALPGRAKKQPYGLAQASYEQPVEEPQVLRPLETWTEQESAADALGRIGQPAVPAIS